MFNIVVNFFRKMENYSQLRIDELGEDAELIRMLKIEYKKDWEYAYLKIKKMI